MAKSNTRLELTWIGKENRPQLEPRILVEDPEKSYHAPHRVSDNDLFDNRLIFGDNLLALKALEQEFTGKIKCVFIDPPYNTGIAFDKYDDGLEHSLWLSLIRERLVYIQRLLADNGSVWVSLDDNEAHYFKVLADEIFGRKNFIADIAWRKRDSPPNDRILGSTYDHILVWSNGSVHEGAKKTLAERSFNLMLRTDKANSQYKVFKEPDGPDPRGPFRKIDTTAHGKGGRFVESLYYPVKNPYTGQDVLPRDGCCWRHNRKEMERLQKDKRLYWGVNGTATTPMRKYFMSEAKQGMSAPTIWEDAGLNQHATSELEKLFEKKATFDTPKPEFLLNRIIHIATNPGDLVLDSFAGSGTTGAVAHKMGRRWIMVELGEHCHTHIIPRMQKVINGEDQGGISKAVNWQGGGGFRYYHLGPTLIVNDEWGNPIINREFNPAMLAEAMCKLEGFRFDPDPEVYWQQGSSTETDFIYVTTQMMTRDMLAKISDEVGPNRSLLICCSAFRCDVSQFENLTIKKIPKAVLRKCEWGHDDYSLEIKNLPEPPEEFVAMQQEQQAVKKKAPKRKFGKDKRQTSLFDMGQKEEG